MYWYEQYFLIVSCLENYFNNIFHENKEIKTSIQAKERHREHKSSSTKNKSQSKDTRIIIRSSMVKVDISSDVDGYDLDR